MEKVFSAQPSHIFSFYQECVEVRDGCPKSRVSTLDSEQFRMYFCSKHDFIFTEANETILPN